MNKFAIFVTSLALCAMSKCVADVGLSIPAPQQTNQRHIMKLKYIITLIASTAIFASCEKAKEAASEATEAAEGATEVVKEAADDAATATKEAADDAAAATKEAAKAAKEAADKKAADAAKATEDAAKAAKEKAAECSYSSTSLLQHRLLQHRLLQHAVQLLQQSQPAPAPPAQ